MIDPKWKCLFLAFCFFLPFSCQKAPQFSKTDQLFALAKLYGYIKYFHPTDEAAALDWDKFALMGSQYVLENEEQDFKTTLQNLFLPVAPTLKLHYLNDPVENQSASEMPDHLNPVYWQHIGNGRGGVRAVYASARVNRPARVFPDSPNDFSSIRQQLNPEDLAGKTIRVKASFQPELFYDGLAWVELRFNQKGEETQRPSTRGQSILSGQWKSHLLETTLPDNIEKIRLNVLNVGMVGGIGIDSINLEVKEGDNWQNYPLANPNFENTKTWEEDWKPWGPNQDFELRSEQDNSYLRISRTLGKWENIPPLFDKKPKEPTILTKSVGCNLEAIFPILIYGDSTSTYPKADERTYQALLEKIKAIPDGDLKTTNLYARLGNVILIWNHLQHFFPYFEQAKVDWKQQFYDAIEKSFEDKTEQDHKNTLKLLLTPLQDSHIRVNPSETFYPPIRWEWVKEQLVITHVLDSTLAVSVGDIVARVNEQTAVDFWKDNLHKTPGATTTRKNYRAIEESLAGSADSKLSLEVKNANGNQQTFEVLTNIEEGLFEEKTATPFLPFKDYSNGVYYVNLSQINWSDLQNRLSLLENAKGIVFDLRGYPRWQTMNIVSHFITDSIATIQTFKPLVLRPDQENIEWQQEDRTAIHPKAPLLSAKKIFITNGKAISYAETFLHLVAFYQLADIVGEQTAGTTGHADVTQLLGGISVPWTGMKVLNPDGSPFHGIGIQPTHSVEKTVQGIRSGKDELLGKALELLH